MTKHQVILKEDINKKIQERWAKSDFKSIIAEIEKLEGYEISSLITSIDDKLLLETIGKGLNENQFKEILSHSSKNDKIALKLPPLLVGLSNNVFHCFLNLENAEISPLQKEGLLEPLQHHLNAFANDCLDCLDANSEQIEHVNSLINCLRIDNFSSRELRHLHNKMMHLNRSSKEIFEATDRALAITWTTNRIDLIEKLTKIKERFQHLLVRYIGFPAQQNTQASGLFASLNQHLASIYTNNDLESLKEDDLSLDGLTRLSIWYLEDYWKLGLLPKIKHSRELALRQRNATEPQRMHYRQQLFDEVQKNLDIIGLKTVNDLKKKQIFSREMLREYIGRHIK